VQDDEFYQDGRLLQKQGIDKQAGREYLEDEN